MVGLTSLTDAEQNSDYERISQVRAVHLLLINNEINYKFSVLVQEASEIKRNITFIQCSMQAEFEEKLRQKATDL